VVWYVSVDSGLIRGDNASPMSNNTASFNLENLNHDTPEFADDDDDLAAQQLEKALEELSRVKFLNDAPVQSEPEEYSSPKDDTINMLYDNYAAVKTPRARLIAAAARTRLHSPGRVLQEQVNPSTPEKEIRDSPKSSPVPNVDFVPTRSQRPLTVPKEFNLSSPKPREDDPPIRHAAQGPVQPVVASRRVESRPLRNVQPQHKPGAPRPLTVPKPFTFNTTSRPRNQDFLDAPSPFVPLAVRVQQFQTKTPARFKNRTTLLEKVQSIRREANP
jgi:hypothetical protein